MNKVTILMPIGPNRVYRQWVPEAIHSIFQQTYPPGEILIIDDGANITDQEMHQWFDTFPENFKFVDRYLYQNKFCWVYENPPVEREIWISKWTAPWNLGFVGAYNCGVGLSLFDNIVYLSSDDVLMPDAVKDCMETWEENGQKDAWYCMTYQLQSGDVLQIPNNINMITRNLWKWLGGYKPSGFVGPDAMLLSILMVHAPDRIIKVKPGKINCWLREHPDQETNVQAHYFLEEMNTIRDKETRRFKPNAEITLK